MKKFFTLALVAASMLLMLNSCEGVKPEFKFSLDLTGTVSNAPTAIAGSFAVDVANEPVATFQYVNAAELQNIVTDEKSNEWLDDYIEKNVLSYLNEDPATIYDITVKGIVKETVTGMCFSVDKRFTNKTE